MNTPGISAQSSQTLPQVQVNDPAVSFCQTDETYARSGPAISKLWTLKMKKESQRQQLWLALKRLFCHYKGLQVQESRIDWCGLSEICNKCSQRTVSVKEKKRASAANPTILPHTTLKNPGSRPNCIFFLNSTINTGVSGPRIRMVKPVIIARNPCKRSFTMFSMMREIFGLWSSFRCSRQWQCIWTCSKRR